MGAAGASRRQWASGGGPAGLATGHGSFPFLLANLCGSSEPLTQMPYGPIALETCEGNSSSFSSDSGERVAFEAGERRASLLLP